MTKTKQTEARHTPTGRTPLNWLVVNEAGKLLAVLDSESEAYWFTHNRGHAAGAKTFKADCDYANAPELLRQRDDAVRALKEIAELAQAQIQSGMQTPIVMEKTIATMRDQARTALANAGKGEGK